MREIKFRAWDGKQMHLHGQFNLHQSESGTILGLIDGGCIFVGERENAYLMQFTGLQDKNGVDIYEGDIVNASVTIQVDDESKVFSYYRSHEDGTKTKHCCKPKPTVVVYTKSGYEFAHESGARQSFWIAIGDIEGEYEVIGNIHEHPELLEATE